MTDKRVLVVGMARSGIAAATMLIKLGARVVINDAKREEAFSLGELDALRLPGVEWRLGEPAETLLSGVDLLVISPGVPIEHPVILEADRRGIERIGEIELAYRYSKAMLVAITGTNGKTTTTALLGELYANAGKRTYVVGNIGYPFTAIASDTREGEVVVCEVSSFQLESVARFRPSVAAILNISEDHMNRHHSMRRYVELKARVFENQQPGDHIVLNYDDPLLRELVDGAKAQVIWFSRTQRPSVGAFLSDGKIVYGTPEKYRVICPVEELFLPGAHNLENALAAVCVAMASEIPPPVIRHTLRSFKGVEHRIEFVRELEGVRYINDSKGTNVDSTLKAIATMDRKTIILLGGYDKKVDLTEVCRAVAETEIAHAVLMGETATQFEKGLKEAGYTHIHHAGYDLKRAIEMARALAEPGSNVLLSPACASFDMFTDFERRGEEFKRIVMGFEETGS